MLVAMRARSLLVCALTVAVVAACGGEKANERPEDRGTAGGFTTYAVPSAEFSVALPECWRVLTAADVFGEEGAGFDELARDDPDLARYRDVFTAPNSPLKLIGIDCDTGTNLNIIASDVPGDLSFEAFVAQSAADLAEIERNAARFERTVMTLPAGKALRLSYHSPARGNTQARATLQYGLLANGKAYFLTYTTGANRAAEYKQAFERSARSFRFL
jgi:hypothetical protein